MFGSVIRKRWRKRIQRKATGQIKLRVKVEDSQIEKLIAFEKMNEGSLLEAFHFKGLASYSSKESVESLKRITHSLGAFQQVAY